jgi:hypothetical protein
MKTRLSLGISLIAFAISIFGGAYLDYFHASSDGDNVQLEWKTEEESNLKDFVIERKTPESSYIDIATIDAQGSNSEYSYLDKTAYKTNDLIFVYRLKIVDNDNTTSYSDEVSVTPNISGIKRTWGSIKAMFR